MCGLETEGKKKKAAGMVLVFALSLAAALAQQPQANDVSDTQPLFSVNAKYTQGVGPGYWPRAGSGLALSLSPGTANCNSSVTFYAGGLLTMAASATNYVYLDSAANCAPASNTTGFTAATVPLAIVVTSPTTITSITDVRTPFVYNAATGGGITSLNGLAAFAQTFAASSSPCADFTITSSGSTHTFCIPTASASARGLLSSADWSTFNAKESVLTFNAPLSRSTNTISCPTCELTSNKNAANGYAPLDASALVPLANLPALSGTGTCTNQFVRTLNSKAAPTCATVTSGDVNSTIEITANKNAASGYAGLDSGARIAKAQAPSTTVYSDASNAWTAGTQDFTAAAVTRPFRSLAFASFPATCTASQDMLVRTDPATAGQVIYICNASGNGWVLVGDGGGSGGGITSLNSLTAPSQSFATGTSGTDFNISSATSTHTFNIPTASASARGLLSSADWSTFNAKESVLTFNSPLSRSTNTISCPTCELTSNKNAASGYAGLDSGSRIAKAQAPSTTVYTDASNAWTAGTQDFTAAAVTRPFRSLAFASFPATCTASQDMLVRTDPATAGQVIYICNASGNGWVLVGDGSGGAVSSVFGRTGAVVAQSGDYTASQVTNAFDITNFNDLTEIATPGTSPAAGKLRMYAKTTTEQLCVKNSGGTETCYGAGGGAVTSVFGRTGAVVAQTGDYTAAQVTNAVSLAPSATQTIQGTADVSFVVKQANTTNTVNPFEVQLKDATKSFYVDSSGNVHYAGSLIGDGTGTTVATFTAGTAPSNPATGKCLEYVDSTSGTWKFLNSSGTNCLDLTSVAPAKFFPTAGTTAAFQACIDAANAAGGGTCDARNWTGSLTMTQLTGKPGVTLLLGGVTITFSSTPGFLFDHDFHLQGLGQGQTILVGASGGKVIAAKDTLSTYAFDSIDGVQVQLAGASAMGIDRSGLTNFRLENSEVLGSSATGQILVNCDGGTNDSTYGTFLHNYLSTGTTPTSSTVFNILGACNQNSYVDQRMTLHANTDVAVKFNISGPKLPSGNTFVGGGAESPSASTGIGVQEVQSGGGNTFYGFRMESLNQEYIGPSSGSSYGVAFFGLFSENAGSVETDNGGLLFSAAQPAFGLRPRIQGYGISDSAPDNLIPNGTLECWTSSTVSCNWTGINWTGSAWNLAAAELTQKASSALTYKNADGTTIATGGSYAAQVSDATLANAGDGIMGPCFKIDPRKQYTLHALLGANNTGTLIRFGFKFYSDGSCATPLTTVATNALYSTYADAATGKFESPATLSYGRTIGAGATFPAHVNGADIPVGNAASTLSPFIAVFRAPTSTAAYSARPVFVVSTVGGSDDTIYVDNVYIGQSWAKNNEEDAPLMAAGPGGISSMQSTLLMPQGFQLSPGGTTVSSLSGNASKLLTAGTISGTGNICADGSGNATTSGCASGGGFTVANGGLYSPSSTTVRRILPIDTAGGFFYEDRLIYLETGVSTGAILSSGYRYALMQLNGTGTFTQAADVRTAGYLGGAEVTSGAASGNDTVVSQSTTNTLNTLPVLTSTPWEADFAVKLNTLTNDYHAVGLIYTVGQGAASISGMNGFWCDVTDTASAGNWACHFQNYSGGFQTTNITLSPAQTASTGPAIISIVASTSEVDFYFNSTKVGCANSGGTGGCTAWTANSLPATQTFAPAWEAKTNAAVAAETAVLHWAVYSPRVLN